MTDFGVIQISELQLSLGITLTKAQTKPAAALKEEFTKSSEASKRRTKIVG